MTDDFGGPVDGTGMNSQVGDGTSWAPQTRGDASAPGGFAHPHYAYGLTRRASDDIHFIARYVKVALIIGVGVLTAYACVLLVALMSWAGSLSGG